MSNEMWLVVLTGLAGLVVGIKAWVSREIDRAVTMGGSEYGSR